MATGGPIKPSSVPFFYGRITREEAEQILGSYDRKEGLYLLRESINPLGNYAISICHKNNFHHYNIEKRQDGLYKISDGRPFPGPIELIQHHERNLDGMITHPSMQCRRQPFQRPIAFRGMTYTELENELISKAQSMKNAKMERALGAQRDHLIQMVAKDLHKRQPWYHGKISRDEADKRMTKDGHDDGKFLVRQRDDKKTFALTLSYRNEARHYMVDKKEKFAIQDGPKFDCLMMLIDHYHNKSDGLLCKLAIPVPSLDCDKRALAKYMENSTTQNTVYSGHQQSSPIRTTPTSPISSTNGFPKEAPHPVSISVGRNSHRDLPPTPSGDPTPHLSGVPSHIDRRPQPPIPVTTKDANWIGGNWEQPEDDLDRRIKIDMDVNKLEKIYDDLPRNKETFSIRQSQLEFQEELGSGQFGSVQKGYCKLKREGRIPVAVKKLKSEDKSAEEEMLKEADLMRNLSHQRIVRMIGLCRADCIMLVLELCPCGPLNSYLAKHKKTTTQAAVVLLMWQVAQGMAYLHSKNYVHRDLAARNVLLVSENAAKISDFGMSKALNIGNDYYKAQEAGKWPLKWYAPECVYYWKFDSKSDVWSYGVTLWEATSLGEKPYRRMKGNEILKFLVEDGKRLAKPEFCDEQVYSIMLNCWIYDKKDRPSFEEIEQQMKHQYQRLLSMNK